MKLAAVLPLTSASVEKLFSKLRLVATRLRCNLQDDSKDNLLFLAVEGAWDPAVGIPVDVLSKYVTKFIARKNRDTRYASFAEYVACRDAVMHLRGCATGRALVSTRSVATQVSPLDISRDMHPLPSPL
eukprot:Hpha_TRINITY_DN12434_c0_g1::TRINITY_DN12434_c0_g1_i2::g.42641::m.42641